ncbi:MAG TPA: TolC family protein [Candidatus Acidoferrales bacterium]|nr:TolC family protein [Candidatus Acidoferrales bacterium]
MLWRRSIGWLTSVLVFMSGCASVALDSGFEQVRATVEERAAVKIFWNNGTALDREAAAKIASLLKTKLTAEEAIQIALLNNRELQAAYSELGVAQADLVQAGLLNNPIFDAAIKFPTSGPRKPDLELSAAMNFLDVFYLPLRKRVAAARFEEAKTRITGQVLDFAARVRRAFYLHQANEQMLELRQTIVESLGASFEVARRLHEAGNITDLELARQRAELEAGKLALRSAEVSVRESREELNTLMGLWGKETEWESDRRLPEIPEEPMSTRDLERLAVGRSLDLLSARQRVSAAGEALGLSRRSALVPEMHAGPLGEREEGAWEAGLTLEFPIPIFDQGQARVSRAAAELRRAQQEYYALAVRVRSAARAARDRLEGARDRALYYRDILLPLQERIVNESQLRYNAMQIGPIELLRARDQQIETAAQYVAALRDYWLARGDIAQILSGRLPAVNGRPAGAAAPPVGMNDGGGH